jgi:hypothetical protein
MYTQVLYFHDVNRNAIHGHNIRPALYASAAHAASCRPCMAPATHERVIETLPRDLVAGIHQIRTYRNGRHTAYQMSCASAIGACCSDSGHACEHSCSCSKVLRRPLPAKQDAAIPRYIVEVCSCSCIGCGCTDPEEKLAYLGDWTPTFSFR